MSLNPLNELKRRLEDNSTPLPKRLCLAKNVVLSHHFPPAPKESIVAVWLEKLSQTNDLDGKELKDILAWIGTEDLTSELKSILIQVLSKYLQNNQLQDENIPYILNFLENDKISTRLTQQIDDYFIIIITVLKYLRQQETLNVSICQRILKNIVRYNRECKKKLEFTVKLLQKENLETLFTYLDTECHEMAIQVCQNVLFPMNKKSFFVSFLQTLIRKDNIDELVAEQGENIQSVVKIMTAFFTFPKDRTEKNPKFLSDFINVFASCFRSESQLVFAFYIMVVNSLHMSQSYLNPAMNMPPIIFEENDSKIKRSIYHKMLEALLKNEVDISVRLTDTFGEKISKVEIKKTFMSFLQVVMMGQLKLEGKLDKATLQIIKTALELDPLLIEQKINQILPPIMTAAKHNTSIKESYTEMLNCLLEILFKLSRGPLFINQILPHVKLCLEACNTKQIELSMEHTASKGNTEGLELKILSEDDLFPAECLQTYGKLTSELMFRQNKELLVSLQKDLEEHCLMMLEQRYISPSVITLSKALSAILSSFLRHNKMADHTVPKQIAEDFWCHFQTFETECLTKFGDCALQHIHQIHLSIAYLKLCLSVAQLKLLNFKYGHTKLEFPETDPKLLSWLNTDKWISITTELNNEEAINTLNNILLCENMFLLLLSNSSNKNTDSVTNKSHLLKQIGSNPDILNNTGFSEVLFVNLEPALTKPLAKTLTKLCLKNSTAIIIQCDAVRNNRVLLNAIVVEIIKQMAKCLTCDDLAKVVSKPEFDFQYFAKKQNMVEYFEATSLREDKDTTVSTCLEILEELQLPYLTESYQLVTIFMLLVAKKCCQKKIRKQVDHLLLNIFELSPKYPDLYKMFPVEYIFSFDNNIIINLLTLKIKTANNFFIIKSILESAVKKVKTDSEVVKNIVDILLSKQKSKKDDTSSIKYFSEPVFQITCIILPLIAKEKKSITTSNYRSILANLQEKLHKSLLKCFKNIDFGKNSSLLNDTNGNIDESVMVSENTLATLNALAAYSLTLSKYCETTDAEEMKNLDFLWSGLEFFVQHAIMAIQSPSSKTQHVDASIQLLNVTLRYIKKLDSHAVFENKDQLFIQIWKSIKDRLLIVFGEEKRVVLDEIAVTLKFVCELASVECFVATLVVDLANLACLGVKKPADIQKDTSTLTSHKVSKYLLSQSLKANLLGSKCVALSKLISKLCKELRLWIQLNFEENFNSDRKRRKIDNDEEGKRRDDDEVKAVRICDEVCDVLTVDLEMVSEAVLAAKKVNLDYKLLDSIFSLQGLIHAIIGNPSVVSYEVSWDSYFKLYDACISVLNSLLVSREELLEDRWPNYMQCYRALVLCLCVRSSAQQLLTRNSKERLAEAAHGLEKLSQSLCARKSQVCRVAAYAAGELCARLETHAPQAAVRSRLERCAAILLQAADTSYSAAFLRRALASSPGHVTLANMYTMYKRYHKYVGNS